MYEKGKQAGTAMFAIKNTMARDVCVAGQFSNWKPLKMRKAKDGTWTCTVNATSSTMEYKFVIDGQWMTDPDNSTSSRNPYGSCNSVARL
jgi:1,4-alpha-glucan branching enzyme